MSEIPDLQNNDLSEIFAINHIFDLLDYQQFDTFLSENKIRKSDELFEGYLFFIKTISRGLLEKLSRSRSLNIEDNYTFTRALHRGVPLEKIKNSSKKVIFIKNLHKKLRKFWKSSDFTILIRNMENVQKNILSSIDSILNCNVKLAKSYENYGKETVVRRLAILYTLIFLNDARHGHPIGYFFSLSDSYIGEHYASKVFYGYKTTLFFLWKRLLSKENVQSNEFFENLTRAKDWSDLDETFDLARQTVESVEKEFRLTFGFENYFVVTKTINVDIWDKKLFDKPPAPSLSKDENLQQELFWYPVQAMTGMYIFNGVATFSSLLLGTIRLKRALKNEEKTFVVRFVHPVEKNKNDYSYAILIEALGMLGDYSGWLVFFDCCGDYSGFAGSEHQFAETIIQECASQIEVINLNISKKAFLEYLQVFSADLADKYWESEIKIPVDGEVKKHKQRLKSLSTSSVIARQRSTIETFKGYLLELLAYYFLYSGKYFIRWRYRNQKLLGADEIDIISRDKEGKLYLVGCMSSYNSAKVKKLNKQSMLIQSNKIAFQKEFGSFESVEKMIFLPEDPTSSQVEECKKSNVRFYSLRRLLMENPRFASIRKTDIIRLFSQNKEISAEDLFFNNFRKRRHNTK